jgi:hypothetical protein
MRKRRITVGVGHASTKKGWRDSALTICDGDKEAVIQIRDPWELRYLRMQLDLIEEHWKKALADLAS